MAKNRKTMKKSSLTRKIWTLSAFLNAVFLVIILAVSLFVYYINLNIARVQNAESQNQLVETFLADTLSSFEHDTDLLANDSDIINYLKFINEGNDPILNPGDVNYDTYSKFLVQSQALVDYEEYNLYNTVYVASDKNCSVGLDGCKVTYDGGLSSANWNLSEDPRYLQLGSNDSVLTAPYIDELSGNYVFSYIEKVFDDNTFVGYVGIDIKLSSLNNLLNNFLTNNVQAGNEVVIVSNFESDPAVMYFSKDTNNSYTMKDFAMIQSIDQKNGYGNFGLDFILKSKDINHEDIYDLFGEKYIVTNSEISGSNFTIIVLVNVENTIAIEKVFIALIVFAIFAIILGGILVKNSMKNSLKPIDSIVKGLNKIKAGNYDVRLKIRENNELKQIGDAINDMSLEIDNKIKSTYNSLAYDISTGLKSRASATREVDNTIFKSKNRAAVCLIQVENLKNISITKTKLIGDNLIKTIADELKKVFKSDERLFSNGGNEFVFIKENFSTLESVEFILNQLLIHFKDPAIIKTIKAEIKFNIGISIYPTDGKTLNELIKKCDTALYNINEFGNKKIIFYNEKIARSVSYQAEINERLAQAVEKGQIYLKYQPLVTNGSEIYGFEALARWNSPALGEIGPEVFIANAEESYLIIPLGMWILRKACQTQVEIKKQLGKDFVMSVNVSPIQILQREFMSILKRIIRETNINPQYLTLEITEGVFIEASVMLEDIIEEIHSMGAKLSLDDFGTGYASLTYLRQIKFDNLKIDKTFVDGIFGSNKDHRIISTIVNLVHDLDMKVIAEGVESRRQYEYLKEISTDIFQGYIFSKPLAIDDLYEFLDKFNKLSKNKRVDYFSKINEMR